MQQVNPIISPILLLQVTELREDTHNLAGRRIRVDNHHIAGVEHTSITHQLQWDHAGLLQHVGKSAFDCQAHQRSVPGRSGVDTAQAKDDTRRGSRSQPQPQRRAAIGEDVE
jgi:predicted esterase YcpF (UPF0227 family)